ncbi:4-hydroxy-3-methylbut-2-enyl diphosphate reductase [Caldanaerobius fijiensis DSM 17918]|uniref:4-hydroxy-3-methylbut-2-enyl diphosphate reductase n=1 Tax=Caldanaerobius fijiensis DSM 17918 TaxID=1121256 RepID=A0A1M4UDX0_9THEO|nr:4-hydroxy-3-methylbut-2-enyl diphosphate reductase [Caldanaerobius fijiensis]SHE54962.1 4-hydroxy-3-methylbut-2-enyl diphosphate reductase [Caldanaerobius fijiensis DSM 17918]
MKIIVAKMAGYCFGVKRAVNFIDELLKRGVNPIYTYGPIIHNPQVVEFYDKKGVKVVDSIDELTPESNLIIRTHGISKEEYRLIRDKGCTIFDKTCPFVKKVQKIANTYYRKGYQIVIVGDPTHPEVKGVNGWCDNTAIILNSIEEAETIPNFEKGCAVSQTTMMREKWEKIVEILSKKINDLVTFNTICDATYQRQTEAENLAKEVDVMIVVGGLNSSNTKKLAELCQKHCKRTYHIESKEQLPLNKLSKSDIIGITAGASTPDWVINSVIDELQKQAKGRD